MTRVLVTGGRDYADRDRIYEFCGLATMVLTLVAALGTVFDPTLWWVVPGGYASALLIAWMERHPLNTIRRAKAANIEVLRINTGGEDA